jgi:predicted hydrocarbon binding protein
VDGGTANFIGFAEALSKKLTPRALADLVTHSPGVISAEIVQDDDGFLVDKFHSRLELSSGEPYVLFPVASFSAMVDSLVDVFGSGGAVIVYQEGLRFGRNDGKILASLLGRDKLRDKITVLPHLASAMGMGLATLTNPDSGELYRLRIEDCFECSTHGNLRRSCDFFRGTIAGLGSEALQMKVECEEVSCRLEGDQWCEFVLRPSPEASR